MLVTEVKSTEEQLIDLGVKIMSLEEVAFDLIDYAVDNEKSMQAILTPRRMRGDYMLQEMELKLRANGIPAVVRKSSRQIELENGSKISIMLDPLYARGYKLDRAVIADTQYDAFFD